MDRRSNMSEDVFKVVELVGTSNESISKAIKGAVAKAGSTLRHLGWFEVTEIRGHIKGGDVDSYQVTLKAGFKLED
jgi:flavin-binding protein dodecin